MSNSANTLRPGFAAGQGEGLGAEELLRGDGQGDPSLLFVGVLPGEQGKLAVRCIDEHAGPDDLRARGGKRAEMVEAAQTHLGNHLFVAKPQGGKMVLPAEGFRVAGIPLFVLAENGVDGMDFPVFAQQALSVEKSGVNVPNPHALLQEFFSC